MTMELILNLVWLFIATFLICVWRIQWIHQGPGRAHGRVRQWSAVSLALVLLFFAVSMSDDIHSEIVALEELSANKRDQITAAASHPGAELTSTPHLLFLAISGRTFAGHAHAVEDAPSTGLVVESLIFLGLKPNRAPPVTLL
jgi:hypothetical protein